MCGLIFIAKKNSFWLKSTEQVKTVGLPPTGLLCLRYPVLKLIFTNIQQGEGMNGVGLKGPHSWLSAHLCFGIHTFKMNHPELSSSLALQIMHLVQPSSPCSRDTKI